MFCKYWVMETHKSIQSAFMFSFRLTVVFAFDERFSRHLNMHCLKVHKAVELEREVTRGTAKVFAARVDDARMAFAVGI